MSKFAPKFTLQLGLSEHARKLDEEGLKRLVAQYDIVNTAYYDTLGRKDAAAQAKQWREFKEWQARHRAIGRERADLARLLELARTAAERVLASVGRGLIA